MEIINPSTKVLSPDEQAQVCQWFAMFHNACQIEVMLLEKYDRTVSHQNLDKIYRKGKKWKPVIKKLRESFLADINKIPIANKAVRVKRLEKIYEEAMTWCNTSYSEWGTVEKLALKAALSSLAEARKEIEGEKGGDTYIINISERMTEARKKVHAALGKNRMPDAVSQN